MSAPPGGGGAGRLLWSDLPDYLSTALSRRLKGLYGVVPGEEAFDSLPLDKQRALLILARRLIELGLWDAVRRVENVYGEGGVGMHFQPWPFIRSTLERRRDFSAWFARHHRGGGGFIERGSGMASLHILYPDRRASRWEAHFDLYNPWASPANAWRHLLHEKIRKELPDWRVIGGALGY